MSNTTIQNNIRQRTVDALLIGLGLFFLLAALLLLSILWLKSGVAVASQPATQIVQSTLAPIQKNIRGAEVTPIVWERNGYTWKLTPRAEYQISARVLGSKRYYDFQSAVMPFDLALGWGDMSDTAVDKWINWRQSGRWYYYTWENDSPYSGGYIRDHSANVHIIPATENLSHALKKIYDDDLILMEGQLMDVEAYQDENKEWWMQTSLTRQDSGAGACEVFYVERLLLNGEEYK